jgi:uncharacterized membrane protein YoaK (UPF0700 family)
MHRYDPQRQMLAIGLAFLAGLVDSTGFVVAGGYFTSFMSGNTTRLGVEIMAEPATALVPVALIGCFLLGVVGGALILRRAKGRHKRILLGLVAVLLGCAAAALWAERAPVFLGMAAVAMGIANNVFSRGGEVTVGVTYMTGALVRFGQGLAARLDRRPMRSARGYGVLWSALAGGAAFGGGICTYSVTIAACAAFAFASLLCALTFALKHQSV